MGKIYIPDKSDVVWLNFNPHAGHEQSGRRPAFVISPEYYNSVSGLGIFCPITNKIKNYPFEVIIPENTKISGTILSDQIKSLDWRIRNVKFICKLSEDILEEVKMKFSTLI